MAQNTHDFVGHAPERNQTESASIIAAGVFVDKDHKPTAQKYKINY